jgi:hypothetical protein
MKTSIHGACGALLLAMWALPARASSTFCYGTLVGPACESIADLSQELPLGAPVTFAQFCRGCSTGGPDGGAGYCTPSGPVDVRFLRASADDEVLADAKIEATEVDCGGRGKLFATSGHFAPGEPTASRTTSAMGPARSSFFAWRTGRTAIPSSMRRRSRTAPILAAALTPRRSRWTVQPMALAVRWDGPQPRPPWVCGRSWHSQPCGSPGVARPHDDLIAPAEPLGGSGMRERVPGPRERGLLGGGYTIALRGHPTRAGDEAYPPGKS